ncbi:hypothetical protein LJC33_00600 [Eubacteriales bacterium OttesenSCG-928-N13]|nr:hypothetical protein [Eubacteriales bacterium OttesenSCG-928-N13]
MTQDRQQAIFEINHTLNRLISAFGFVPWKDERARYEGVVQGRDDYVSFTIWEDTRFNDGELTQLIRAKASVCMMNPNANTNELRWAAEQIQRAAGLADAINALELHYTERVEQL